MNLFFPTPHPDVNAMLGLLLTNVREVLQDQFLGMYLFGSLANGDFDQHSDVDVLIVTKGGISKEAFAKLHAMHQSIAEIDSPWAFQLEVSYIPQGALRRYDPSNNQHPHLDRDRGELLHMMQHGSDWVIQRYILRERGVVIAGPDPQTLIDPISSYDLRWAIVDVLPLWFNPILDDPSKISKRGYQSFFVLSICRIFYTLKHGEIISKRVAAGWGMKHLDPHWTTLIERALIGRQNPDRDATPEDITGTLNMMRFALQQIKPTPYPDVNEVLHSLLDNAKKILGDKFVGMYLYGSLSSGDFDPETSDIDFLFITSHPLSDVTIAELETMHKQTWATALKQADNLEGAYVSKELIRRHDPNGAPCPTVNEGKFYVARLGSDWIIQRHVVRDCGVIIEGPDPKELIDDVSPDDLRGAVMDTLREWWFPMLDDPSWLRDHDYRYHSFAILSMCRTLHALEHGTIVSKPVAAGWAQEKLGGPWRKVIELALIAQKPISEQFDLLDDALDFIRFVREQTAHDDSQNPS